MLWGYNQLSYTCIIIVGCYNAASVGHGTCASKVRIDNKASSVAVESSIFLPDLAFGGSSKDGIMETEGVF